MTVLKVLTAVGTVFGVLGIILMWFGLFGLILDLSEFLKQMAKKKRAETKLTTMKTKNEKYAMSLTKTQYTSELFAIIINIIEIEVSYFIMQYSEINKHIEIANIDNKIQEIAEKVFDGLKEDTFITEMMVFDDEYVMKFIVNTTTQKMIEEATRFNQSIRN